MSYTKVCPRCGAEIDASAAFCPKCGNALANVGNPPVQKVNTTKQVWLWVCVGFLVLVIAVAGAFALGRGLGGGGEALTDATETEADASIEGTTLTEDQDPEQPAESKPAEKPKNDVAKVRSDAEADGRFDVFIKKLYESNGTLYMDADYVQVLTGKEAEKRAAQDGDEVNNDYYLVNDNPKIRKIPMKPNGQFRVYTPGPSDGHNYTIQELVNFKTKKADESLAMLIQGEWHYFRFFSITVKKGWITKIDHVWVP